MGRRSLCALEGQLGILERSNANTGGGRGMDAGDVQLAGGAAGEKVQASFVSAKQLAAAAASQADAGVHSAALHLLMVTLLLLLYVAVIAQ